MLGIWTRDGSVGGSLSGVLNLELQNPFSPTKVTGGGSDRRYHAYVAADRDTTVSRRHLLLHNSGGRSWYPGLVSSLDGGWCRDFSNPYGVRSIKEMDSAINDLTSKFKSMYIVIEEIRSAIVGGRNHLNREGNERGNHRCRTSFEGYYDNHGRKNLQNEFGDVWTSCLETRSEKRT
ncbi:hypothetical protein Tco_1465372 [Tanacetum coccineum]